jgi:hypothetical protein
MSAQILLEKIDSVRRRQRSVAVAAGVCKTVLAALGLIVAFFLLDWLILSRSASNGAGDKLARGVLVAAMLGTFAYVVWRTIVQELQRHPDDDEIALRVEKGHPELRGRLISTIQLTRGEQGGVSQELIEALEADTLSFAGGLTFTDIINVQVLKKVALVAGGLFVVATALGAWRSDFAKAVFARLLLTEQQYPTAARFLSVTPGGRVAHGEPFTITVELDPAGVLPESASVALRTPGGQSSELALVRAKAGKATYTGTIEHVLDDLEFRPAAHDALWPRWEQLHVLQRPAVKALSLAYHFPAYLGKPDETSSVGDIRAPVGTVVKITATLNKPVTSARVQLRDNQQSRQPIELKLNPEKTVATVELQVNDPGYYKLMLRCVDGFENVNPIEYAIDAVKDRVPTVKIAFPAQDKTVTRFAHWPIRFTARDDYGVVRGSLKYRISTTPKEGVTATDSGAAESDAPAQSLALDGLVQGKSQKEVAGEVNFDLRPLNLAPDQRVTYWIEVEDNQQPAANHGRSQIYTFNVVDVAVLQEMLDRDRNAVLEGIQTIRDKEKDTRDGVDQVRRAMPAGEPPKPETGK